MCTLPAAERPPRLAEFDAFVAGAVIGLERPARDRLRLAPTPGPEVAGRAAAPAMKESRCCSFFTFTLTAAGGALHLEIAVPERHRDVLDGLAARFAAAGPS